MRTVRCSRFLLQGRFLRVDTSDAWRPRAERTVEGGAVEIAEVVGLKVFILSFGDAGLLGIGDHLDVVDNVLMGASRSSYAYENSIFYSIIYK